MMMQYGVNGTEFIFSRMDYGTMDVSVDIRKENAYI